MAGLDPAIDLRRQTPLFVLKREGGIKNFGILRLRLRMTNGARGGGIAATGHGRTQAFVQTSDGGSAILADTRRVG